MDHKHKETTRPLFQPITFYTHVLNSNNTAVLKIPLTQRQMISLVDCARDLYDSVVIIPRHNGTKIFHLNHFFSPLLQPSTYEGAARSRTKGGLGALKEGSVSRRRRRHRRSRPRATERSGGRPGGGGGAEDKVIW